MRIVFMGTADFAVPVLKGLVDKFAEVSVYTQPDRPAGRGHRLFLCPVKKLAVSFRRERTWQNAHGDRRGKRACICKRLAACDVPVGRILQPSPAELDRQHGKSRLCSHKRNTDAGSGRSGQKDNRRMGAGPAFRNYGLPVQIQSRHNHNSKPGARRYPENMGCGSQMR